MRPATAITSIPNGAATSGTRWASIPSDALDEAIRVDNACLEGARREGVVAGDPSVPRQQPEPVVCRGRLRPDRREAVHAARRRRLPARVRVRARRHVRAAALRAARTRRSCWVWSAASCPSSNHRISCVRRIEDASRYVPLENLALSPQCGFASTTGRQSADRRGAVAEAAARRRHGARGLGAGVI